MNNKIKKTFSYLVLFTIFMFSFSYMLVPLYDVFCEITGLNGKTGRTSSELVIENPLERNIEVTFTSSVANLGPFNFKPNQKELVVKPGKIYTAFYTLTNLSDTDLIATASPSVVPGKYAEYFKKIECFCFQHQEIPLHSQHSHCRSWNNTNYFHMFLKLEICLQSHLLL